MKNLTVVDHPLLKRDVTILRRRQTPYGLFRKTLSDAAAILAYEAIGRLKKPMPRNASRCRMATRWARSAWPFTT